MSALPDGCGALAVTLVQPPPAHVGEEAMGPRRSAVLLANTWDVLVSCGAVESTDLSSQPAAPATVLGEGGVLGTGLRALGQSGQLCSSTGDRGFRGTHVSPGDSGSSDGEPLFASPLPP